MSAVPVPVGLSSHHNRRIITYKLQSVKNEFCAFGAGFHGLLCACNVEWPVSRAINKQSHSFRATYTQQYTCTIAIESSWSGAWPSKAAAAFTWLVRHVRSFVCRVRSLHFGRTNAPDNRDGESQSRPERSKRLRSKKKQRSNKIHMY